jgi:DeoR/GlpR family transcriptional regulator of sugar metabolism
MRRTAPTVDYATRLAQSWDVKEAIGTRAAALVEDGDSIVIDGATTALALARSIKAAGVRVLTNSLEVARVLAERPGVELIVLGGRWDPLHHQMVGPATVEQLERYRVDKLFLGMGAIDRANGLTEPTEDDAAVKRAMIQVAQEVIGLADHSKFGRVAFAYVAPASVVDILVTDELADCSPFADLNWELLRVPPGDDAHTRAASGTRANASNRG